MTTNEFANLVLHTFTAEFLSHPDKHSNISARAMGEAIGAFRGNLSRNLDIRLIDPPQDVIEDIRCQLMSLKAKMEPASKESSQSTTDQTPSETVEEPTEESSPEPTSSATDQVPSGKTTATAKPPSKKPVARPKK